MGRARVAIPISLEERGAAAHQRSVPMVAPAAKVRRHRVAALEVAAQLEHTVLEEVPGPLVKPLAVVEAAVLVDILQAAAAAAPAAPV